MKKNLMKCNAKYKGGLVAVPIVFIVLSMVFSIKIYAQTYVVKGTISTSTSAVRYASVTFVDNSDTTRKFFVLTDTAGNYQLDRITSVKPSNTVPASFELEQNYPNPFSSSTAISYKLNKQSDAKLTIYDILGRKVREFPFDVQAAGVHGVVWNGRDDFGKKVAVGVYLYRLQARGESQVKKMVFGLGEGNNSISLSEMLSSQTPELKKEMKVSLNGITFTVRIANTDTTSPAIISQEFDNVVVQSDTTLNFTVNGYIPPNVATVYLDSTEQIIRGFGGANLPGSDWNNIADLTANQVDEAFGTGVGQIGLTILRVRVPQDSTKFYLEVPTAKAAESFGAIVIATPWTPPAWMKSNNSIIGGYLDTNEYAAYAAHLKAFADSMSNDGAPLYAISVQNEPDAQVNYQSCFWNATQFLNFMKNNASAIGVPVFMPESEKFDHSFSDSTLNDSSAAANVAFVAGHLYGSGALTSYPLALSKSKELWMTEHYTDTQAANTWPLALNVGKEINDCMNANMSGYVWWYIRRSYCLIDESSNVTKRGYVMSQYSKFVRPGFHRVSTAANPQANVYVTAFKNGSNVVIVALNLGTSPVTQAFAIPNASSTVFTPYVTSSSENCFEGSVITVSGSGFTATLEPTSITTFVSE